MSIPLVSLIIPAYDAEKWILDAIHSVQAQTEQDWQLIVVNDGSKDNTSTLARSIEDTRIQVVDNPNGGVSNARNTGLELAKGQFISFLDADDAMLPNNLALKLAALIGANVDWVFGDLVLCDALLRPTGRVLEGTDGDVLPSILLGMLPAVPGPCSNIVAHRRCFDGGLRFDTALSNAADQDIALNLARTFTYARVPMALTLYRMLPGSMSSNIALYEQDHLRLMEKARRTGLLDDPAFHKRCMANAFWAIGGSWWVNGRNKRKALLYILKALWLDPEMVSRKAKGRSFKF